EARVGTIDELPAQRGILPEIIAEGEEIVHVETGVAEIALPGTQLEPGRRVVQESQRATREEAEGRGPRGHALDVAHQGVLGPVSLARVRIGPPAGERIEQGRGGEE